MSAEVWDSIHAVSVEEIVQLGNPALSLDCSVSFSTRSATTEPWRGHPLQAFPVHVASRAGSLLPQMVTDPETAKWACYTLWPCARVDLYNAVEVGPGLLHAHYFTLQEGQDDLTTAPTGGNPTPVPPSPSTWNSSVSLARAVGLGCAPGHTSPDPTFIYDTYIGHGDGSRFLSLLAIGALPPLQDLGLPTSTQATPQDVLAAAGAIKWAYVTQGHLAHLWPNAGCPTTPVSRDATTGCSRSACPLFTVCPMGARVHARAWGTCFPSLTSDPKEVLLTVQPLGVNYANATLTFGGTALAPSTPSITLDLLQAIEVSSTTPTLLPCGAQTSRGVCAHFSMSTGVVAAGAPVCACASDTQGTPSVTGDVACQFNPDACATPALGPCSGHGTCAVTRDTIAWDVVDIQSPAARAVGCVCTPPWTGPLCASTLCAQGGMDCGAQARGTCAKDAQQATWVCTCTFPLYGPSCEFRDAHTDTDTNTYGCYIQEGRVQDPAQGTDPGAWLLCSGRGTCAPRTLQPIDTQDAPGACVCDPGWQGEHCEFKACQHAETCGAYGRCLATTTPQGRAAMTCACMVHTQDQRLVLAKHSPGSTRCDVSLCQGGSLVLTWPQDLAATDVSTTPRGVCVCRNTVSDPVATLGLLPPGPNLTFSDRWGTPFSLPNPRHVFLPTFVDPNETTDALTDAPAPGTPFSFIPTLVSANRGLLCEVPQCPTYTHPITGDPVPGTYPCGVDPVSLAAICVPCSPGSPDPVCISAGGVGGRCDCTGATWSTARGGLPYWDPTVGGRPWAPATDPRNPMCEPWCANDGVWFAQEQRCICDATAFTGPRCSTPKCPRGTPAIGLDANCSACPRGWSPAQDCAACARGYQGPRCATCAPGFFLDTSVPPDAQGTPLCTACAEVVATKCPPPANSNAYTCDATTGPLCTCNPGYAPPVGAPPGSACSRCATGFAGVGKGAEWRCLTCAAALQCAPSPATKRAVCPSGSTLGGTCECANPNMNARCTACLPGFTMKHGVCTPCVDALGCSRRGTLSATCSSASSGTCTCNATAGFTGTKCSQCVAGWVAVDGGCAPCETATPGGACGPWGVLDCSTAPPRCACTRGMAGPGCASCDACGPGGTCALNASSTPTDPWCVCRPGYTRNGSAVSAPCSLCSTEGTALVGPNGVCESVVAVCGSSPGVNVAGTVAALQATFPSPVPSPPPCVCMQGFTGPTCTLCATGHAGPGCAPCPPTGQPGGAPPPGSVGCTWDPVLGTAHWACGPGGAPPDCQECLPGWVTSEDSDVRACVPCPTCGRGGVCAPGPTCICLPGFIAGGGPGSGPACDTCAPGTSPLSCRPCDPCAPGRWCTEPPVPSSPLGVCVCMPGHRTLAGLQTEPGAACFTEPTAVRLELVLTTLAARRAFSTAPNTTSTFSQAWNPWVPNADNPFTSTIWFFVSCTVSVVCVGVVQCLLWPKK